MRQHTAARGALDGTFDDPIEEADWMRAHARAWESLPDRHRIVLLVCTAEYFGEIPDRVASAGEATVRLGLTSSLSENAYSIRITRAGRAWIEALGKVDPGWDHEFERLLVAEQGKRVMWGCTRRKVDEKWWLDRVEQAVFSVTVELALRRRARATALAEAARRAGQPLSQADFDAALVGAQAKLEGVGAGPFYNTRMMMEYVAERWDAVQPPGPAGTSGGEG
jgi:hypothetical protein